jgi:hypothetical protein
MLDELARARPQAVRIAMLPSGDGLPHAQGQAELPLPFRADELLGQMPAPRERPEALREMR